MISHGKCAHPCSKTFLLQEHPWERRCRLGLSYIYHEADVVMWGLSTAGTAHRPSRFTKSFEIHLERQVFPWLCPVSIAMQNPSSIPAPSHQLPHTGSCSGTQPGTIVTQLPGCVPKSPGYLVLMEKEGKPGGFSCSGAAIHTASISTNVTFSLRGRREWWVCRHSPALFTPLNNLSVAWHHSTAG